MIKTRYRRITFFFARVILTVGFWDILLPHIGLRKLSARTRALRMHKIATRFRLLAITMGGVMIKVGQFLSARVDVLPPEITQELSGLQDEVPAEPFEAIRKVAETDMGIPLDQRFSRFEPQAIAAASLGQVHQALLKPSVSEGEGDSEVEPVPVVVKIQRPDINLIIATDLAALRTVGKWLQRYPPIRRRANVSALIEEFSRILYEEIDYLAEGRNVETFAEHFKTTAGVRVPRVIWTHTTQHVLTLEDVRGIKIDDYTAIANAGIDRKAVAVRLLEIYFKQIFEDGFFHADPHPGNLFINVEVDEEEIILEKWYLTLVDFGMVGRITPDTRRGLREMLIAFGTRDSARLIRAYQLIGVLLPGADLALLEKANARAFNIFWGKNMTELMDVSHEEMAQLVIEFRDLILDLPFQVPQDLIFLGRAVGLLSGLCTGLDPQFNVWEQLAPYAKRLLSQEMPGGILSGLPENLSEFLSEITKLLQKMVALPGRTEAVLERVERGELVVRDNLLTEQVRRLSVSIKRLAGGIIFAALVLAATQSMLGGQTWIAAGLSAIAMVVIIWILFAR